MSNTMSRFFPGRKIFEEVIHDVFPETWDSFFSRTTFDIQSTSDLVTSEAYFLISALFPEKTINTDKYKKGKSQGNWNRLQRNPKMRKQTLDKVFLFPRSSHFEGREVKQNETDLRWQDKSINNLNGDTIIRFSQTLKPFDTLLGCSLALN